MISSGITVSGKVKYAILTYPTVPEEQRLPLLATVNKRCWDQLCYTAENLCNLGRLGWGSPGVESIIRLP